MSHVAAHPTRARLWRLAPLASVASATLALACSGTPSTAGGGGGGQGGGAGGYDWGLPAAFPKPKVPEDNPMSAAKVELGRHLFYDTRLSLNETQSCASCHLQELAFTDGLANAVGSTGEVHPRSSMAVMNVGYYTALTWANNVVDRLEEQALLPIFGEAPVELGFAGQEDELLARLAADPTYVELFAEAFPDEAEPISLGTVTKGLASFERALVSHDSPYDRYVAGDTAALSEAALRGQDLFFSESLECFHCHGGFNFSDSVATETTNIIEVMFHNTGLYNIGGTGDYPPENTGLHALTGVASDMGRFRTPSLRNIAKTAPYMHDGSIATLDEVIDHYAAGGRTITEGPYAGVGSESIYKSELVNGFELTAEERADLIAFLESLTDETFLSDPRFASPF